MTDPKHVHEVLGRHQLADGLPMVLDLEKSTGPWFVDARDGQRYLDFFTCFATWPIGYNHPGMDEPGFREELMQAALNNPSNSDVYTESMARFVETFATRVTPAGFPHHFWVAGGALGVENALKAAFDWKAQLEGTDGEDQVVLHFQEAFHGRTGYTLSLTNTEPNKIALFPKFAWPRVSNPKIEFGPDGGIANDVAAAEARTFEEIEAAYECYGEKRIAAILLEPVQCEGGDNHFRTEFLQGLRRVADERRAMLVFDEVQTGFFGSGKAWLWEHHGVQPDLVAFGKKTQVCGMYAGTRIDEVEGNVFRRSGRINSTWGGNLVDMVRARRFAEIILDEGLHDNVLARGESFVRQLRELARERGGIRNVRGVGSLAAFDVDTPEQRGQMLQDLMKHGLIALPCGPRSVRFRMPFVVTEEHVAQALERIAASLPAGVGA